MNRTSLALFSVCLTLSSCVMQAAIKPVEGTRSPDTKTVIVVENSTSGAPSYFFYDTTRLMKVGDALPKEQQGDITNVRYIAKWSRDSSMVALKVFYGSKLNELLIYRRNPSGSFRIVPLQDPYSMAMTANDQRATESTSGWDENYICNWVSNNSIVLIFGQAKELASGVRYFMTFTKTSIDETKCTFEVLERKAMLTEEDAMKLVEKWEGE